MPQRYSTCPDLKGNHFTQHRNVSTRPLDTRFLSCEFDRNSCEDPACTLRPQNRALGPLASAKLYGAKNKRHIKRGLNIACRSTVLRFYVTRTIFDIILLNQRSRSNSISYTNLNCFKL